MTVVDRGNENLPPSLSFMLLSAWVSLDSPVPKFYV